MSGAKQRTTSRVILPRAVWPPTLLVLAMLVTGCAEQRIRDSAQAQLRAGDYEEALQSYQAGLAQILLCLVFTFHHDLFRQTKIQDLDVTTRRDDDVRRFDITMHDIM